MDSEITMILVIAVVVLLVFLICRELVCWYNKVNKRVKLLEEQVELLKAISSKIDDLKA